MTVALDNDELRHLIVMLKSGEYSGSDLMRAWIAIDELIEIRERHTCADNEIIGRMKAIIADDAWAISFQTMGQYRSALMKILNT